MSAVTSVPSPFTPKVPVASTEPMPRVEARMFTSGPDGREIARVTDISSYGTPVAGKGQLGEVIHQASRLAQTTPDTPWQAHGVYEAQAGAYEIRPLRYQLPMQTGPLLIDPPADAPGVVPIAFEAIDPTLRAIAGAQRFTVFHGEQAGSLQQIVTGPPGVAVPAIPARGWGRR